MSRKSTPTLWAEDSSDFEIDHTIFILQLPTTFNFGQELLTVLSLGALNTKVSSVNLNFDPAGTFAAKRFTSSKSAIARPIWSSARLSRAGWEPVAALWRCLRRCQFSVVDDKTGKVVFSGQSSDLWPANKIELHADRAQLQRHRCDAPGFFRLSRRREVIAW